MPPKPQATDVPKPSIFNRLLLVWLCILSAVAYFWPADVVDPFMALKPMLGWIVAVTMFCVGTLLPADEVRRLRGQLGYVALGTLIQCTVMPLAALTIIYLWQLEGGYRLGMLLVGCVPGAMASNVLTLAARGNVSYSISLTTLATLLSPLTVPLLLSLTASATGSADIDELAMMKRLILTVLLPVTAGYTFARIRDALQTAGDDAAQASTARRSDAIASVVANVAILLIIAIVVAISRERVALVPLSLLAALLAVNLIGYAGGYFGGKIAGIDEAMRRALTLEVGMQNAGLGTLLAVEMFESTHPGVAIPTAAYTFGCMFTGTILATLWSELHQREAAQENESGPAN